MYNVYLKRLSLRWFSLFFARDSLTETYRPELTRKSRIAKILVLCPNQLTEREESLEGDRLTKINEKMHRNNELHR